MTSSSEKESLQIHSPFDIGVKDYLYTMDTVSLCFKALKKVVNSIYRISVQRFNLSINAFVFISYFVTAQGLVS